MDLEPFRTIKTLILSCETCDYTTSNKYDFERHNLTRKHIIRTASNLENPKYTCNKCSFISGNKHDFERHCLTRRHVIRTESNEENSKNSNSYSCSVCSKEYQSKSGLWSHKKKCVFMEKPPEIQPENTIIHTETGSLITIKVEDLKDILQSLIETTNKSLTSVVETNNKHNAETQNKFMEMITASQALITGGTNNSHNNITNSNNNNKTFNLQFFLNETCKNAMNVSEFVENIKIDFNDVENIGNTGYVKGITDIIVKNLHSLGITERPFHCTDTKRETIYIKDNNEWNKDTEEKTKFKAVLNDIANKNWKVTKDWTQTHPNVRVLDSEDNKMYMKLFEHIVCVKEENNPKYHEKVIKNMVNSIKLDKEQQLK